MARWYRIGAVALAACAAAVLAFRAGNGVETDLYGLADVRHGGALKEIAESLSGQGRILVEGPEREPPVALAVEVARRLDQKPMPPFTDTLAFLAHHKAGLLAPETRERLLAGRFADVAADALAQLYGLMPSLFSVKEDPFLLATGYAQALQLRLAEGWTLKDGFPSCVRDGRAYLLVTADLSSASPSHIASFLDWAEAFNGSAQSRGQRIWCSGPPFHAARTSQRAKREINILSILSIAAVLGFGWMLFRSLRFVPALLMALVAATLFAAAALFAAFPRPHVLTFVFGTSLIGLSVDYVYHARAAGGARHVARPLSFALLTTVAAFAPLLFAAADVLRQMAVFTIAGLTAVWVWAMLFQRDVPHAPMFTAAMAPARRGTAWMLALLALAVPGLMRIRVVHDPAAFYSPDAYLAMSEKTLAELNPGSAQRFVYVRGATLQEALEREEAAGVKGLSAVIPSLRRQRENAALIARLHAMEGASFTAKTGLAMPKAGDVSDADLLDPELVTDERLKGLVRAMRIKGGLVSPCPQGFKPHVPGVSVLEPRRALSDLFASFTSATMRLLGTSALALTVLLFVLFRWRAVRLGLPVAAALFVTMGALGWLGVPLTFFTLLCIFVLAGLALDYAIFSLGDPSPATRRTVRFSFLTSFVGLGALGLTDFAVTRAMGITFAIGLAAAWLFARLAADGTTDADVQWHRQSETGAGALRMRFMWLAYRWFGKGFMKVLCVPVMACIYPFARPARDALREFYAVLGERASGWRMFRHLLGFAWSLADKTDACTLRKNLPRMTVRDDSGWKAFDALTRSGKGAFLISTHVGTVEVLPALPVALGRGDAQPHVHAFQQMGHDAVFMEVFMRHFDGTRLTLHAVEDIGVETAVAMQDAIGRGELVLMAGDRVSAGSGKTLRHGFLGRTCAWPKGVFAFARLMEAPVFFVTCLRTGWNAYEVHFAQWDGARSLLESYVGFLEAETLARPDQWYQFYRFFSQP